MKKIILMFISVIICSNLISQDYPVAVNDTITVTPFEYTTINVKKNDYDPGGKYFHIMHVTEAVSYTDSTITFYIKWKYELDYDDYIHVTYVLTNDYPYYGNESVGEVLIKVEDPFWEYLDINEVRANINSYGSHFTNPNVPSVWPGYEFPKGTDIITMANTTLWIGGVDNNDELLTSAYMSTAYGPVYIKARDYWSGPLSTDGLCYTDTSIVDEWRMVWKINLTEVLYHIDHWNDPGYEPPEVILSWPAHGDTSIHQSYYLAPFVDVNGDEKYEPMEGDFPLMRGDQSIFFIFNDQKPHWTDSEPIGIEIHGFAWAFSKPDSPSFDNTIFLSYKLFNRSGITLNETYISNYCFFYIGQYWPRLNAIGTDVERGFFYCFHTGDNKQINNRYKITEFPIQGAVILGGPYLDPDNEDNSSGGCDYSINGVGFGDGIIDNERFGLTNTMNFRFSAGHYNAFPYESNEFYDYMRSFWLDGTIMEYGGNGHVSSGAYGPACRYVYPGLSDPCNWGTNGIEPYGPKDWTEETAGIEPGFRLGPASMGPFTLEPGVVHKVDIAFVSAFESETLTQLEVLQHYVDTIRAAYLENPDNFGYRWLGVEEHSIERNNLNIYPNPCKNYIYLHDINENSKTLWYDIYSITGHKQLSGTIQNSSENSSIDVSLLNSGLYVITVIDDKTISSGKFIKQ